MDAISPNDDFAVSDELAQLMAELGMYNGQPVEFPTQPSQLTGLDACP